MARDERFFCPVCKDLELKLHEPADGTEPTVGECMECGFETEIEEQEGEDDGPTEDTVS